MLILTIFIIYITGLLSGFLIKYLIDKRKPKNYDIKNVVFLNKS